MVTSEGDYSSKGDICLSQKMDSMAHRVTKAAQEIIFLDQKMMLIAEWMTIVDPTGASVAQSIKLVA